MWTFTTFPANQIKVLYSIFFLLWTSVMKADKTWNSWKSQFVSHLWQVKDKKRPHWLEMYEISAIYIFVVKICRSRQFCHRSLFLDRAVILAGSKVLWKVTSRIAESLPTTGSSIKLSLNLCHLLYYLIYILWQIYIFGMLSQVLWECTSVWLSYCSVCFCERICTLIYSHVTTELM